MAGFAQVFGNPPLFGEPLIWNRADVHRAEIPGANGIATARSMATMYDCLACGGSLGDFRLVEHRSVVASVAELSRGTDPFGGEPQAYGAGYELQTRFAMLGPAPDVFGHGGAGGPRHGAWPSKRTGFSYAMNQMREDVRDDRSRVLLTVLYTAATNRR